MSALCPLKNKQSTCFGNGFGILPGVKCFYYKQKLVFLTVFLTEDAFLLKSCCRNWWSSSFERDGKKGSR